MAKLMNEPPKNLAPEPKNLTTHVFLMSEALNEGDWLFIFKTFKQ